MATGRVFAILKAGSSLVFMASDVVLQFHLANHSFFVLVFTLLTEPLLGHDGDRNRTSHAH